MKNFLMFTALAEGLTGILLLLVPTFVVPLLLSTPLSETGGIIATRFAGIAIITLAVNCWFSKNHNNNVGLIKALLFYNFAVCAVFINSSIAYQLVGTLLWLVVIAHATLGLWTLLLLKKM